MSDVDIIVNVCPVCKREFFTKNSRKICCSRQCTLRLPYASGRKAVHLSEDERRKVFVSRTADGYTHEADFTLGF